LTTPGGDVSTRRELGTSGPQRLSSGMSARRKARPKRARTERREDERRLAALGRDAERLFSRGPGGSPERAIDIDSVAIVEPRSRSTPCPRCGGEHSVDEHAAVTLDDRRLREAKLRCRRCGTTRSLWFRLRMLH